MIALLGTTSAIFYSCILGWCFTPRHPRSLLLALIETIGASVWLSWIIVVTTYLFKLPTSSVFPIAVIVCLAVTVWKHSEAISVSTFEIIGLAIFSMALLVWITQIVLKDPYYAPVFQWWDALVSWNRWGIQLAHNEYKPYSTGYPVLIPGLWSLVYRAQGTSEVWLFAKATLFVFPIVLMLLVLLAAQRESLAVFGILCVTALWHLLSPANPEEDLLGGYMDLPVSIIILISSALLALAVGAFEQRKIQVGTGLLFPAALFAGIAGATKQAGVIYLVMFCIALLTLLQRHLIQRKDGAWYAILSLTPILGFLLIFKSTTNAALTGNLEYFSTLALNQAGGASRVLHAAGELWSRGSWLFILFVPCSAINLFKLRTLSGFIGSMFLAASVLGFFIFAQCCSYATRNGLWLVPLLGASAMLGVSGLGTTSGFEPRQWSISARGLSIASTVFALCIGFLTQIFLPDTSLKALQAAYQSKILAEPFASIMRKTLAENGPDVLVISAFQPLRFFPGVHRYELCFAPDQQCVEHQLDAVQRSIVVTFKHPDLEYASPLADRLASKLIGSANGFTLYGPFEGTNSARF